MFVILIRLVAQQLFIICTGNKKQTKKKTIGLSTSKGWTESWKLFFAIKHVMIVAPVNSIPVYTPCRRSDANLLGWTCRPEVVILSQEAARPLHLLMPVTRDTLQSALRENPRDDFSFSLGVSCLSFGDLSVVQTAPVLSGECFRLNVAVFTIDSTRSVSVLPGLQDTKTVSLKKLGGKKRGQKKPLWSVTKLFLWGNL